MQTKDDIQNNKNIFHEQQKITVNQIRDQVDQIISKAKEKALNSVFPNAAIIGEKIQYYDAREKAISVSETSVQSDYPESSIKFASKQ